MGDYKTETSTFTFDKMRITDITVTATDNKKYIYKPKEDITPYELAMMLHLFTFFHLTYYQYDYWEFITRNKLERHFESV